MGRTANLGVVLVTGATGFLGSHLVGRLVSDGVEVHALVRQKTDIGRLRDIGDRIQIWRGDVCDVDSLMSCIKGVAPQTIFHLAGDTSARRFRVGDSGGDWELCERAIEVNLHGTINLVRAAEASGAVQAIVRAGGLAEYGPGPSPSREQQREQPVSPYAASQVAATHWCQMLQHYLSFPVVTLRLGLTYGPNQAHDFFIPATIDALLRRRRVALTSGGQGRDFVYVDDAVMAMRAAALRAQGLRGAVINVASGTNVPMNDVAYSIADLIGAGDLLDTNVMQVKGGDVQCMSGDTAEAGRLLGWRATTSLREGLQRTIDWHRSRLAEEACS